MVNVGEAENLLRLVEPESVALMLMARRTEEENGGVVKIMDVGEDCTKGW